MAKIAETFECKALINAPEFNISKGNIYIVRPDHPPFHVPRQEFV